LTLADRWILHRLQEVIRTCSEAYESYEFHRVYHTLNQFCAVDLSSLYVDITKDRLYCDAPSSPRRRATQTVMHRVFDALVRLLAPLCPFTAEEAWSFFGRRSSVHIELFPAPDEELADPAAAALIESLLGLRAVIAQSVEQARQEKTIGNALEAAVVLAIADPDLLASLEGLDAQLEEFFILSDLKIVPAAEGAQTHATLERTPHKKCERCWRHRPTVGLDAVHPGLCDRCADAVAARENLEAVAGNA
jgi:isoleucyl-tRNA synthetase